MEIVVIVLRCVSGGCVLFSQTMLEKEETEAKVNRVEEVERNKAEVGEDAQVASEMMGELEALLTGEPRSSSKSKKRYALLWSLKKKKKFFFFFLACGA